MAIPPIFSETKISDVCDDAQLVINPIGPTQLFCRFDGNQLNLELDGGIPPFIWAALGGEIVVTGDRTATISIGGVPPSASDPLNNRIGRIAYFKPHMFTLAGLRTSSEGQCPGKNPISAIADVRLRAYDCLKRHIPFPHIEPPIDNLYPDYPIPDDPGNGLSNPIGEIVSDRNCVINVSGWNEILSILSCFESDPEHWTVCREGCQVGTDTGSVSVTISGVLAGKHGPGDRIIHAAAPPFNETKNVPMQVVSSPGELVGNDIDFDEYLDVRNQAQVDTECCTIPTGSDVTVLVTDAVNVQAILIIPVVNPT